MSHGFRRDLKRYLYLALSLPQLQALAAALEVNKILRLLIVAAPWESSVYQVLRTVEEMKRSRGDDLRLLSGDDEEEAKRCWGLRSR